MTTKKASKKKASKKRTAKAAPERAPEDHDSPQQPEQGQGLEDIANLPYAAQELSQLPAAMLENPEFQKFAIAKRVAHVLAGSRLVPDEYYGRPSDVFVAIQMGDSIGLDPFQAVQSIAVIHGRPCLWGDALIGVCRASPLCEWIEESLSDDGQAATCTTQRKGDRNPISKTFTIADATAAGILNNNTWQKYQKRMLQMRARAFCLRDAYPDVLKGLSVAEEVRDFHGSPAPIQDYQLPKPAEDRSRPQLQSEKREGSPVREPQEPEPEGSDMTITQVKKLISAATNMEFLLKAGDAAKLLTDPTDIQEARLLYQQKRDLLNQFGSGITDPAQGEPARGRQ